MKSTDSGGPFWGHARSITDPPGQLRLLMSVSTRLIAPLCWGREHGCERDCKCE
jgi:hypothetical protein